MMISNNDSDVAMYNEGTSLDSCTGHSSADGQYHYHANILCDQEAADPDTCKHIGYMRYMPGNSSSPGSSASRP